MARRHIEIRGFHGQDLLLVPSSAVESWARTQAVQFLQTLVDSGGLDTLRAVLRANGHQPTSDEQTIGAAVDALCDGSLVFVRVEDDLAPGSFRVPGRPRDSHIPRLSDLTPRRAAREVSDPPTWLALEVVHESGLGFPHAGFELILPDGRARTERLDAQSRWRADDISPAGRCSVRFVQLLSVADAVPVDLPMQTSSRAMLQPRGRGSVGVDAGRSHRLVVPKPTARVMQIEGLHFGSARAVVVPTDLSGTRRSMLDVLAAVIACAVTSDPAPELVVAGHTDRSGSAAANLVLSEARARNVELLLRADKTGWATHTFSHYAVEDLQLVYGWAAARQLWPCDPGPVDNELGPRTKAARRAFREAYNHEMAGAIPLDEEIGVADFEALFELYVDELGLLLSDLGDVGTLSAALRFAAPAVLPCGEAWPCNAVTLDGYEAGGDRRIDILLFDPDELPDLGAVPIGVDVYGRHKYRSEALPDRSAIRLVRLQLRDHRGVPRVGCEYEVTDVRGAHVGATDAHGFTERFLADSGDIAGVLVEGSRYRILVSDQPSDALRSAQTILNALGFDAGALGQSDRRTRAAIRNFQWVEGLFITGELDDPTSAALQNAAWRRHGGS